MVLNTGTNERGGEDFGLEDYQMYIEAFFFFFKGKYCNFPVNLELALDIPHVLVGQ